MWNTTIKDVTCDISVNLQALGISDAKVTKATSLSTNETIPYKRKENIIKTKIKTKAHDIDAIIIKAKK